MTSRPSGGAAFILGALGLLACAGSASPVGEPRVGEPRELGSETGPATSGPRDPLAVEIIEPPPLVSLIEPGAPPRRQLRYAYPLGTSVALALEMTMATTVTIGAVPLSTTFPKTVMHAVAEVTDATGERFRVRYQIIKYDVTDDGTLEAKFAARYRAELDALVGLEGAAVIDDRGIVLSSKFNRPPASPGEATPAGSALALRDALTKLAVPLPLEPIGVGGSWTVGETVTASGISRDVVATYELLAVNGDAVTVRQSVAHTGKVGEIKSPALPDATMTLLALSATTGGEQTLSLRSPRPSALALESDVRTEVELRGASGSVQTIATELRLKLSLVP